MKVVVGINSVSEQAVVSVDILNRVDRCKEIGEGSHGRSWSS